MSDPTEGPYGTALIGGTGFHLPLAGDYIDIAQRVKGGVEYVIDELDLIEAFRQHGHELSEGTQFSFVWNGDRREFTHLSYRKRRRFLPDKWVTVYEQ